MDFHGVGEEAAGGIGDFGDTKPCPACMIACRNYARKDEGTPHAHRLVGGMASSLARPSFRLCPG